MFDFGWAALASAAITTAEAQADQREMEMIMKQPLEIQGELLREMKERKERTRIERRERDMHDQLCRSIEKAGDNARPRGGEFY